MEGILIAVISGLFSLAGIWLSHYLKEGQKARESGEMQESAPAPSSTRAARVREKKKRDGSSTDEPDEFAPLSQPVWWLLSLAVVALSIGGAFFARWVVNYFFGIFQAPSPDVRYGWLVLLVAGLAWGVAYVVAGLADAEEVLESLSDSSVHMTISSGRSTSQISAGACSVRFPSTSWSVGAPRSASACWRQRTSGPTSRGSSISSSAG